MSTQQTSLYTLRGEPRTPGKSRRRPDERTEAAVDTANMANMTHSCLARLGMRAGLTPLTSEALALDTLETDDADGTGEAGREWQGDAADGGHEGVKGRGRTGSRAESVGSDSVLGSAASPIGGAEVREATRSYNDLLFNSSDRWTTNGTPLWKTADASETVFATHAVLSAKKKKKKKKKVFLMTTRIRWLRVPRAHPSFDTHALETRTPRSSLRRAPRSHILDSTALRLATPFSGLCR